MAGLFICIFNAGLIVAVLMASHHALATDFQECFRDKVLTSNNTFGWVQTMKIQLDSATDPRKQWGVPANNNDMTRIVPLAISYDRCIRDCSPKSEPFSYSVFSAKFTTWLVPWLALLSQLPFGTHDAVKNLLSVLLAVGSPTLAGYSLAITVLNGRWLNEHVKYIEKGIQNDEGINYTSSVQTVLDRLQQTALRIDDKQQLAFLVTSPNGHVWWKEAEKHLNYPETWTIAAVTTLGWVFISYVLTVADTLMSLFMHNDEFGLGPGTYPDSYVDGQVVGGIWLWLLPVVVGWLLVSPKCDCTTNSTALEEADNVFKIVEKSQCATKEMDVILPAITLSREKSAVYSDENCSAPIFNYARLIPWTRAVETILAAYHSAAHNKQKNLHIEDMPDYPPDRWRRTTDPEGGFPPYPPANRVKDESRVGSIQTHSGDTDGTQISVVPRHRPHPQTCDGERTANEHTRIKYMKGWYCIPPPVAERELSGLGHGYFSRFVLASLAGLALQSGTAASAIIALYKTPTVGIGCRCLLWSVYAGASTLIWMLLVTSSFLASYAPSGKIERHWGRHNFIAMASNWLSICLHYLAQTLAVLNAFFIVATSLIQFSNVFRNCYCDCSVIGLGKDDASKTFWVLDPRGVETVWIVCVASGVATSGLFLAFLKWVSLYR